MEVANWMSSHTDEEVLINTPERASKDCTYNFMDMYGNICKVLGVEPLDCIKLNEINLNLKIKVNRIGFDKWQPLLRALRFDRTLHIIELINGDFGDAETNIEKAVEYRTNEDNVPAVTDQTVDWLLKALHGCLSESTALTGLVLWRIPLSERHVLLLCEAVGQTRSLQHLVLDGCLIGDRGCLKICKILGKKPTITWINLSECNLTQKGAARIASLLKKQELVRAGEWWRRSLRGRDIDPKILLGLSRITLNHNSKLGDEGAKHITDALYDDFWIKAIDMQNCGLTDRGFRYVYNLIKVNRDLGIFDIRGNNIRPESLRMLINKLYYNHRNSPEKLPLWMKLINVQSLSTSTIFSYQSNTSSKHNEKALRQTSLQSLDTYIDSDKIISNRSRRTRPVTSIHSERLVSKYENGTTTKLRKTRSSKTPISRIISNTSKRTFSLSNY